MKMPLKTIRYQNVLIYIRNKRAKLKNTKQPKRSSIIKTQVMIIIVRFSGSAIFVCSERNVEKI